MGAQELGRREFPCPCGEGTVEAVHHEKTSGMQPEWFVWTIKCEVCAGAGWKIRDMTGAKYVDNQNVVFWRGEDEVRYHGYRGINGWN